YAGILSLEGRSIVRQRRIVAAVRRSLCASGLGSGRAMKVKPYDQASHAALQDTPCPRDRPAQRATGRAGTADRSIRASGGVSKSAHLDGWNRPFASGKRNHQHCFNAAANGAAYSAATRVTMAERDSRVRCTGHLPAISATFAASPALIS